MGQRGMGAVGMIAAMVVAGLIVYGIINYGPEIWRDIQGGDDGSTTPLEDIVENPGMYSNQHVSTIGMVIGGGFKMGEIVDDEGNVMKLINVQKFYATPDKYKVVGKVVLFRSGSSYRDYPFFQDTWVIEVSEIIKI